MISNIWQIRSMEPSKLQPRFLELQPTTPCYECPTFRPGFAMDITKCDPCKTEVKPYFITQGIENIKISQSRPSFERAPHHRGAYASKFKIDEANRLNNLVNRLGYQNQKEMLSDLYAKKPIGQVMKIIGYGYRKTADLLTKNGIQMNKVGYRTGINNPAVQTAMEKIEAAMKRLGFQDEKEMWTVTRRENTSVEAAKKVGVTEYYMKKRMLQLGINR